MGQFYLYRHSIPNGEPFYIGIGTKTNVSFYKTEMEYKRAFSKKNRNFEWHEIVNKHSFDVEILYESDSKSEINCKEFEFISLYGRRDLRTGILVNLNNGGQGQLGFKHSELTKQN